MNTTRNLSTTNCIKTNNPSHNATTDHGARCNVTTDQCTTRNAQRITHKALAPLKNTLTPLCSSVQAAALSTYTAAIAGGGAFETALEDGSKLGTSASYTSSLASDDADFSQVVSEQLSSEQLSNPFMSVKIMAGWWRGAVDRIDGVRECKVNFYKN